MDTLIDVTTAIEATSDANERADLYLNAGARQTDMTNYTNAVNLLIEYRNIIATFDAGQAKDYAVSQLAFEFARARDATRAQTALQHISDDTIENEARARIAIEASKYNANVAQTVINTINDIIIKDQTIIEVAYERAKLGNLNEALNIIGAISDETLIPSARNQAIRYASEVIT